MEINKPDKGVFKGFGRLEEEHYINKKYYPKVRNIHQFEYTHHHANDYLTSFERFFNDKSRVASKVEKAKPHQSSLILGNDQNNYYSSLTKNDFKRHERVIPPKLIRNKEEGIGLENESFNAATHFLTTAMEKLGQRQFKESAKVTFKDRGLQRFNPITGESRKLSYGFQDFSMGRNNNLKANNRTVIPQSHERIDIISGRKLTFG